METLNSIRFTGRNVCWKLVTEPGDSRLCMPEVFVRLCNYTLPKTVFLLPGDGSKHPVCVKSKKCTAFLTDGWSGFRDSYQIGMFNMLLFCWNDPSNIDVAVFKRNGSYNKLIPGTDGVGVSNIHSDPAKLITGRFTCWKLITSPKDDRLCMPDVFVSQCQFSVPTTTLLVSGDGFPHRIGIKNSRGTAYLTDGWSAFSVLHDICLFHMLLFSWDHPSKIDVALFTADGGDTPVNTMDYELDTYITVPGKPGILVDWARCASAPPRLHINIQNEKEKDSYDIFNTPLNKRKFWCSQSKQDSPPDIDSNSDYSSFELGPDSPEPCLTPCPTNSHLAGHYEVKLKRVAVEYPYFMELPMRFGTRMLNPGKNPICFKINHRGLWPVTCELGETKCIINVGWEEFVKENNLKWKDTIVISRPGQKADVWTVLVLEHAEK